MRHYEISLNWWTWQHHNYIHWWKPQLCTVSEHGQPQTQVCLLPSIDWLHRTASTLVQTWLISYSGKPTVCTLLRFLIPKGKPHPFVGFLWCHQNEHWGPANSQITQVHMESDEVNSKLQSQFWKQHIRS